MSEQPSRRLKVQGELPIRAVGIEVKRERDNFTDLPPQAYMHVWFARRPVPAARLGVLASVLPEEIDDDQLLRWMGMDANNVPPGKSLEQHIHDQALTKADSSGLVYEHFGYRKAYKNQPAGAELAELHEVIRETWDGELPTVLDATAGGGAIPFEAARYGLPTIANELNPVASVILEALLRTPTLQEDPSQKIIEWGDRINARVRERCENFFAPQPGEKALAHLWAHTIECPDCSLTVPLSPNWWLSKDSGTEGVAVRPEVDANGVSFSIVRLPEDVTKDEYDPNEGSISYANATCPRCQVTIESEETQRQAQEGGLGYQLYAIERRGDGLNFREPTPEDLEAYQRSQQIDDPEFSEFMNAERYVGPADRSWNYGITNWRDMYSPRQLRIHYEYWRAFEAVKPEIYAEHPEEEAALICTYLAMTADKAIDYNSRQSLWIASDPKLAHAFDRHDFAFAWSFAENHLLAEGLGYEWTLNNVAKSARITYELADAYSSDVKLLHGSADSLPIDAKSVDAIVLDPPYYHNVMYAELSDYFYVLLRHYLDDIYPEFFSTELAPKADEAVANTAKFDTVAGSKSKKALANDDYERKMIDIFEEMNRILDDDGIFTLMFTHKLTEAWDTLTTALIEAGFIVTATHPVNTESGYSLHQKNKNAAKSTILLASEKRPKTQTQPTLWSDIRTETRQVARAKAAALDASGDDYTRIDIILASFGDTLEVFTRNYPVVDDTGEPVPPQVALDEAREAVRAYLIEQYLDEGVREVDPVTEWYLMAWLVFEARRFRYDEANRLGKGLGVEVDAMKHQHRLWRKRSDDIVLRSHDERVQTSEDKERSRTVKPVDPAAFVFETDLDKVHAAMYHYDRQGLRETETYMTDRGFDTDLAFRATVETLLRVLPSDHPDWELLRDMVVTDIGALIDVKFDAEQYVTETDPERQDKLSSYR